MCTTPYEMGTTGWAAPEKQYLRLLFFSLVRQITQQSPHKDKEFVLTHGVCIVHCSRMAAHIGSKFREQNGNLGPVSRGPCHVSAVDKVSLVMHTDVPWCSR